MSAEHERVKDPLPTRTRPHPQGFDAAVRAKYAEDAAAYREAAEKWRMFALRNDSLGETARRKHLHCLARAWQAEEVAS